ncbi:MAG TPA: hypothetical protein VFJ57_15940 [Solirubrobacterales bacterium]|nr:hypothetical protein [Solirubrobacterales bacterium]
MRPPRPENGLCDRCRHQRLVGNTRGSVFSLCERSRTDPEYPRYPRIPVLACPGFEPAPEAGAPAPDRSD